MGIFENAMFKFECRKCGKIRPRRKSLSEKVGGCPKCLSPHFKVLPMNEQEIIHHQKVVGFIKPLEDEKRKLMKKVISLNRKIARIDKKLKNPELLYKKGVLEK